MILLTYEVRRPKEAKCFDRVSADTRDVNLSDVIWISSRQGVS